MDYDPIEYRRNDGQSSFSGGNGKSRKVNPDVQLKNVDVN